MLCMLYLQERFNRNHTKMKLIARFVVIITLTGSVFCSKLWQESSIESNVTSSSSRQGRVFPFWSIGRIANSVCTGTNGLTGTCQIRGECAANGGLASGSCTTLTTQAVCCTFITSCGTSTSQNVTYFTNTGYPSPFNGGGTCTITVVPPDTTVCQLRVDFTTLTLAQPSGDGVCNVDNVQISGGASSVPVICGDNNGQHVYVAFNGIASIRITVSTTAATAFNRFWLMQLSMISCTSQYQAPAGCLQYFFPNTGIISSFNYGSAANPALNSLGMIGTRQLANSNYGICIRANAGNCAITYALPTGDSFAFTMSNDATAVTAAMLGTAAVGASGAACTTDYLIIPNPTGLTADRFCGLGLASTQSATTPFVVYYVTSANDAGDVANRGFRLTYTQNACAVATGK
ncbi:uncharacterized protein LOC129724216 [Wyeomyia smithii]|uniref:uncharacterized protein LOC129724216 n=1 Tax=Wyeomyia smithii TaxID=174621 RepID=UPI002467AEA1|nr:uncharacterized protein LOC129724216 [Wyeomyia smithii]